MTVKNDITNQNELEFAIFCIENIAIKLGIKANSVYKAIPKTLSNFSRRVRLVNDLPH